jgi:hypothetical protein
VTRLVDGMAEAMMPLIDLSNEAVSLRSSLDHGQIEKEFSKMFCVGPFGMSPTPPEPLALNVDHAPLQANPRPLKYEVSRLLRITVNSGTFEVQSSLGKHPINLLQIPCTFADTIATKE